MPSVIRIQFQKAKRLQGGYLFSQPHMQKECAMEFGLSRVSEMMVNPNDRNAIEAALCLRETHGGEVTILSMGPSQVEEATK